jgi:hypothetical protein
MLKSMTVIEAYLAVAYEVAVVPLPGAIAECW